MARTLILCPTFDHADALIPAISSVRAQTDPDWEMVVMCDGSPPRTFEILETFARLDPRIRYVSHPKSPRTGEPYRDAVIRASDAEFVLHLGDDDVWSPHHLAAMLGLLEGSDWAHQATLSVTTFGQFSWNFANIQLLREKRAWSSKHIDARGLNNVGYRHSAYMRLPKGWETTPKGQPTDTTMWAKFLALPDLRVASSAQATWLKLPGSAARATTAPTERAIESGLYLARMGVPGYLGEMCHQAQLGIVPLRAMLTCDTSRADTFEAAVAACGWRLNAADPAQGSRDQALIAVELSDPQREMLEFTYEIARLINGTPVSEAITAKARENRPLIGKFLATLAKNDWPTCERLIEITDKGFKLGGVAQIARLRLSLKQGNADLMARQLAESELKWPNAKWITGFRAQLETLQAQ